MRFARDKSDETHSGHYHNNDAAELAEYIIGCSLPKGSTFRVGRTGPHTGSHKTLGTFLRDPIVPSSAG